MREAEGLKGGGERALRSGMAAREENPAEYIDMVVLVYDGYGGISSRVHGVEERLHGRGEESHGSDDIFGGRGRKGGR